MTNLATLFVGFGMFGSFLLIPQLAEAPVSTGFGFGLGATGAGLLMLPGSLAMLFIGPGRRVARRPARQPDPARHRRRRLTSAGLLGLVARCTAPQAEVVVGSLLLSIGVGFAFAAMPNLIVEAVPLAQTGEATGFNTLLRNVGASARVPGLRGDPRRRAPSASGPTDAGYTTAFMVCALIALAGDADRAADPARARRRARARPSR